METITLILDIPKKIASEVIERSLGILPALRMIRPLVGNGNQFWLREQARVEILIGTS